MNFEIYCRRKLTNYSDTNDGAYLEGSQYNEDTNNQISTQHSRPSSPTTTTSAYQQHIQQQKRLRYRSSRSLTHEDQMDDEMASEPEWINSTLEHNNETKNSFEQNDCDKEDDKTIEDKEPPSHVVKEEHENVTVRRSSEKRSQEQSASEHPKIKSLKRKNSKEELSQQQHKQEPQEDEGETEADVEPTDLANVPQTVEEIESVQQSSKEKSSIKGHNSSVSISVTTNSSSSTTASCAASPPSTSVAHKTSPSTTSSSSHPTLHHHHSHHGHLTHSHHTIPPAPPLHPQTHHFGKYVPEGYLINEHGILMTHDFIHAPTASIPISSSTASNGHHHDDYVDIKMEEFSEAELRLTSEEMSQWQDVIKMDDYLAKGRRPQFWEEPFTRRVSNNFVC